MQRSVRAAGLEAECIDLRDNAQRVRLAEYGAVILASAVRIGRHLPELVEFVKDKREYLAAMPNAFVSVLLSQTGAEDVKRPAEDRARYAADVAGVLAAFEQETKWKPQRVKAVAGALPFRKYNFVVRFVMKQIARKQGAPTDTSRDYEFTNWDDVAAFARSFAEELQPAPAIRQPA